MNDHSVDSPFDALKAREPIFHRPEFGITRADFGKMIAPDFWEVGASGRVYRRDYVLDNLEQRHAGDPVQEAWSVEDCACRALGNDTYLFTYRLHQGPRISRRSTLWHFTGTNWVALYHQGTLVSS